SLRQRKRAGRRVMMAKGDESLQESRRTRAGGSRYPAGGPGLRRRVNPAASAAGGAGSAPSIASADRAVDELRVLASQAEDRPTAVGPVSVVWTWWIIAPIVVGVLAIAVLAIVG
ncbi:MAG TPA: hypothetical protein VK599_21000, partial [Streptosporangiaceae bacterium]|nr:hypothetical protein [Streptosporangiaceae bacterium]